MESIRPRRRVLLGPHAERWASLVLLVLLTAGCYNPSVKIDGRDAMEQQLTRVAIRRSIAQLAIHKRVLEGQWRIRVLAPNPKDADWVVGCLELRLSSLGVRLTQDENSAASIVVAYVTYAGTDVDNFYIGVPIPGGAGQALAFYQSITERGRASISLSFQESTGKLIGTTDAILGVAHYTDMYFMTFIGPFALTDLDIQTGQRFTEIGADTLRRADTSLHAADSWILPHKKKPDDRSGSDTSQSPPDS